MFQSLWFLYQSKSEKVSDKLPADLGYLYENVVAQMIKASGRDLYYHTWRKKASTHSYEIDFLITAKNKVIPIEVKSSAVKNHESINQFEEKYSGQIGDRFLLSQKDVGKVGTLKLKPIYMTPFCWRIFKSYAAYEEAKDFNKRIYDFFKG